MMTENNLTLIPNLINVAGGIATNDMTAFPDSTSACTTDKLTDPDGTAYTANDADGYVLHTHDLAADDASTPTVNYFAMTGTQYYYTCEADGTVRQWSDAAMTIEYTD